ncbi:oligosaccharide flippase family protein [Candidatus Saccharibacteria bacterium]|jgi:integral membrane protein mviN|nr:oligosaccharide flippase family protein [Candidatus Saccharibacteria bacterium]MBB1549703.1 oligosaccharide flippase family protein [Candidatus Saccharibacteria bacterium]MBF1037129.1 oligosaccharide flippase family protein [Candidatus Nanosynbacter sp.]
MANSKLSVKYAAILLSFSTLISALLGIFRDRLLNSYYLDTYPTGIDAYTAAFTIPDFMFFVLTSGALAVSFIPVFNQRLVAGNKKSAWELSSSILNLMAIVTLISSILIMIFADPLVRYIVGPGLDESGTTLAINMMRVIAINPFLFSIATVLNSIQQAVGRFVFYSLAPALYNVGILIGITVFTNGINIFGLQLFEGGIMGVAIGVVFGAVLQIFISLIGLFGLGFDYQFKIYWKNLGFKTVLKLLPARSLDQGIDYVYSILATNLSSRMGKGALRSFQQANSLHQMPVNLIGVAISTAFFPKLTEETNSGDTTKFDDVFRRALRMIVWISLPVSVIAYFARGYVVSFVKNGGQPVIASILGSLVLAIFAQSIFHIASRGFYARQDTKTPFIVSIIAVGFTMVLSVVFSIIGLGPDGLGWAQSIGAILEIFILLFILQKKSRQNLLNKDFWSAFFRMLVATVVTSVSAYILTKLLPLRSTDVSVFVTIPKFLAISLGSMAIYFAASFLLDLEEVQPFFEKLNKILFRNLKPKDK